MPHGRHIYAKASNMANITMCAYTYSNNILPYWKCVLRWCAECPQFNIHGQETNKNMRKQHPQLGFTFITSLHVVILMVEFRWKTRKYVTFVNKNLHQINLQNIHHKRSRYDRNKNSDFNTTFYIAAIQKLAFNLPHERILGTTHCGEMRCTAFKWHELFQDILCCCVYAERVVANFDNQIQSE